MKEKIAVIGGGVIGITTAITFQLLGFETTCYAKQLVGEKVKDNPCFASQYPAASVIPHSVYTEELKQLFPASQSVFERLYDLSDFHVTKHRHFEVSEFSKEQPAYSEDLHQFSSIIGDSEKNIPHRKDAPNLYGWAFDCYVAEWPEYIRQLYRFYQQLGGQIHQQEIRRDGIAKLPSEIVVNCAGLGAWELADDLVSAQLIRGHLVHLQNQPLIRNKNDQIVSYNYTPDPSIYSIAGEASDVYFYPVNGRWVFGGSRQCGTVDDKGNWQGETYDDVININGTDVPSPIITLNRDILSNSFGADPDFSGSNVRVYTAYRFTRNDAEQGLRISTDEMDDKLIVHNYGHGGAGVTLSWGCALKVLQYIKRTGVKKSSDKHIEDQTTMNNNFKYYLHDVYNMYFE